MRPHGCIRASSIRSSQARSCSKGAARCASPSRAPSSATPTFQPSRCRKPELGGVTLAAALTRRRSSQAYGQEPLELRLARNGAGRCLRRHRRVRGDLAAFPHRPVGRRSLRSSSTSPVVASRGSSERYYHYDPLRNVLERLRPLGFAAEIEPLTPYSLLLGCERRRDRRSAPSSGDRGSSTDTARTGSHCSRQDTSCRTPCWQRQRSRPSPRVPVGGFFDRRADALIDADGLAEAVPVPPARSGDGAAE